MEPHMSTKMNHSQRIADELAHFLADTYILYLKTQNFHWNVKGENFYSLHKMFEEQYIELANAIDEIAERIRALGAYTPASFTQYQKLTSLKEETHALAAKDMVKKLLKDHETLAHHANIILARAQKAQDEGTIDLLIERSSSHEKTAWMLRSTLG